MQQYAADALQNIALHNSLLPAHAKWACRRPTGGLTCDFFFCRVAGDNKAAIAAQGGVAALVTAMVTHAHEARVQQYCCFALANLSANYSAYAGLFLCLCV